MKSTTTIMLYFSAVAIMTSASAKPCDAGILPEGVCVTPVRVVWCEDGYAKALDCDDGLACKWNDQIGAFDCLPGGCSADVDNDGDAEDIPATGMCATPQKVVWCEAGEVKTLKCGTGFKCGWSDASGEAGAHDCLPATTGTDTSAPDADAGSSPDASDSTDAIGADAVGADGAGADTANEDSDDAGSTFAETDTSAGADAGSSADTGLKPVIHGDMDDSSAEESGDGGCSAGAHPGAPMGSGALILLVILTLASLRGRRVS